LLSIRVDNEKCNGCRLCEVVCAVAHSLETNIAKIDWADLPAPRLRVEETDSGEGYFLSICRHCEQPACVDGCVSGALFVDEKSGVVDINIERCIGCWSCVMECPFGGLSLVITDDLGHRSHTTDGESLEGNTHHHAVSIKCDGCRELSTALCLRFCPTGALRGEEGIGGNGGGPALARRLRRERVMAQLNLGSNRGSGADGGDGQ